MRDPVNTSVDISKRIVWRYSFFIAGNTEDATNAASTASTASTAMEESSKSDTDAESNSAAISATEKNNTVDSEPWFYISNDRFTLRLLETY